jgi:hypothetical protein
MPAIAIKSFITCPRCQKIHGPTPACPYCGWLNGCSWCESRVEIPGRGWTLSQSYRYATSHGMCVWCAVRALGGDPKVLSFAAERLGIPAGLMEIRATVFSGGKYLWVGYGKHTGWAGLMKPVSPLDGLN